MCVKVNERLAQVQRYTHKTEWSQSANEVKALLDIKWDANRDPTQKFVFTLGGIRRRRLNYEANCAIEYPGRIIKGNVNLEHKGNILSVNLQIDL